MSVDIAIEDSTAFGDRDALRVGTQRAFAARPQQGNWRVRVIGDNHGKSDRYLFYFEQDGRNVGILEQSVADLHLSYGPAQPRKDLVSAIEYLVVFWFDNTKNPVRG